LVIILRYSFASIENRERVVKKIILLILIVIALAAGGWYWMKAGNPNALRHIVLDQCLPNQLQHRNPAPCAQVKPDAGYVVFKDRNGPLQYLLMPTYRINGTESPLLTEAHTPNFFWLAWQSRSFMTLKRGSEVPDSAISLTINSPTGRTQNHFHIDLLKNSTGDRYVALVNVSSVAAFTDCGRHHRTMGDVAIAGVHYRAAVLHGGNDCEDRLAGGDFRRFCLVGFLAGLQRIRARRGDT